ncbi:MAG: ABC transporter permease [Defluviitaleaceae bacterium]|nr:ABC transporter permease [Defluviitaleaceae bacterium]
MRNLDVLGMCLRNLIKRKLRTFLTMLGVIIGTAALVLTISLGLANEARFDRMVDEWDRDLTIIQVQESGGWQPNPETGEWEQGGLNPDLNDEGVAMLRAIEGVRSVSPSLRGAGIHLRSGPYIASLWDTQGIDPATMYTMGHELIYGRLLEPDDPFGSVVVGAYVELFFFMQGFGSSWERMQRLWMGESLEDIEQFVDMINDTIAFSYDSSFIWRDQGDMDIADAFRPIRSFPLNVVGVFAQTGMWNVDEAIFMDIESVQELTILSMEAQRDQMQEWGHFSTLPPNLRENFDQAIVRIYDVRDVVYVTDYIRALGFNAWSDGEGIARRQEMQQGTLGMLMAIAAVSIVVAAISIANTMIMAVYERTREIGVMKVIGGAIADIRKMFLLEAALIGLFGGILGVALSLGGSYVMNNIELEVLRNMGVGSTDAGDVTSLITPWLMGVALAFASLIGLVSGYFPARRATKLSALEAIRTD